MDRLKALKIKESDYFFSLKTIYVYDSISHVSWLSDQFCICMIKLRFFSLGSTFISITFEICGNIFFNNILYIVDNTFFGRFPKMS